MFFAAAVFILYESGHKLWIGEQAHDSLLGIAVMLMWAFRLVPQTAGHR